MRSWPLDRAVDITGKPWPIIPKKAWYIFQQERMDLRLGSPRIGSFLKTGRTFNTGRGFNPENTYRRDSMAARDFGKLIAWDPVEQEEVWSVRHNSSWNAGVLTTDELVFQGNAEGDFSAYDASTGEKLWSENLHTGIIAPPITYQIDGTQYVSILAGWGGFLVYSTNLQNKSIPVCSTSFALDAKANFPEFPKAPEKEIVSLDFTASDEEIAQGAKLYEIYCRRCHGGGVIPDLTYSSPEIFNVFQQIVGDGIYAGLGMPKFGDRLSEEQIQNIKYYILSEAKSK